MGDIRSTSDDCCLTTSSVCKQDNGNEESMNAGSSFSSAHTIIGTTKPWIIPTTPKMAFPIEGHGDGECGGKMTVRWSPYMEELDSSNYSSFELMPTESALVGKEDRCPSPLRNLVLDGPGSSYVVPTVLSCISSNGEKNQSKA